jgi:hypothetical protein
MRTERKNKRKEEMKLEVMSLAYLQILQQLPEDWCFLLVLFITVFECATAVCWWFAELIRARRLMRAGIIKR